MMPMRRIALTMFFNKIEYCNDRYPLDCHLQRVREDKCIKLSHP